MFDNGQCKAADNHCPKPLRVPRAISTSVTVRALW